MTKACTVCSKSFASEQALQAHMNATKHNARANLQRQSESSKAKPQFYCGMCEKAFAEKAYLQQHMSYHVMPPLSFKCSKCQKFFPTSEALQQHPNASSPCVGLSGKQQAPLANPNPTVGASYSCSICPQSFNNPEALKQHSKSCSNVSYNCEDCTEVFRSQDALNNHIRAIHSVPRASQSYDRIESKTIFKAPGVLNVHKESSVKAPVSSYSCFACAKFFKSETEAQKHMAEAHGVCSSAPRNNLQSRPSIMRGPPAKSANFGRIGRTEEVRQQLTALHRYPTSSLTFANASLARPQTQNLSPPRVRPPVSNYPEKPSTVLRQTNNPIAARVSQLQLPEEPVYASSGEVIYSKNRWTGIPVPQQATALSLLAQRCHLPKFLQNVEYLPSPYNNEESSDDQGVQNFERSPSSNNPKRKAIVLSSHKAIISGGKNEILLLSAIDYITGEVLISHLVLPDGQVDDWRSSTTGITLSVMTDVIKKGFAVLNGWRAAREALWLLIDSDTILVGHTLRHDLDALRMIHGCGVDVAILAQKSAGGTLSKRYTELDNLCRELLKVEFQARGERGLDCLEVAFATRELMLWSINNEAKLAAWAKQKNKDQQRDMELVKMARNETDLEKARENG